MILVDRQLPDSRGAEGLAALETEALTTLRRVVAQYSRDPTQAEIERFDYRIAGSLLCHRQGRKCAYCEHPEQRPRNDVEHFRPKTRADRGAAHPQTHGYWWLAWRWDNLLFACRNCNQSQPNKGGKLDKFPLEPGSGVLVAEQDPYGADAQVEAPLLLDPSRASGIEHIEYKRMGLAGTRPRWYPVARDGSLQGDATIRVCGLDRDDLLDAYDQHVESVVWPLVNPFDELLAIASPTVLQRHWQEIEDNLYRRGRPFVALSYDALRTRVSDAELAAQGIVRRVPR
jgi:hypothetical protein